MSLELIRLVGVWSGCRVVRDAPPGKPGKNVPVTNNDIMKMWGSGSKFRVILSHNTK
jgi:hypothetical protein